jgi:hypothetical protein
MPATTTGFGGLSLATQRAYAPVVLERSSPQTGQAGPSAVHRAWPVAEERGTAGSGVENPLSTPTHVGCLGGGGVHPAPRGANTGLTTNNAGPMRGRAGLGLGMGLDQRDPVPAAFITDTRTPGAKSEVGVCAATADRRLQHCSSWGCGHSGLRRAVIASRVCWAEPGNTKSTRARVPIARAQFPCKTGQAGPSTVHRTCMAGGRCGRRTRWARRRGQPLF